MPQISVICGPSAGGGSYAPALTDFVIMTGEASMFLTGPGVVKQVMGEDVDGTTLGGPRVHERNGVCHMVAPTEVDAALLARDLLDHLPQSSAEPPMRWPAVAAPTSRPTPACRARSAASTTSARSPGRSSTAGACSRSRPSTRATSSAPSRGSTAARSASSPTSRATSAACSTADAAMKAARFVRTCNLFGLPMVVLVDTPGFLPGTRQEKGGVIRHGAKLVHAFAEATVPRVTIIVRKAFGGAFIAMNAKDLGADFVFAWPSARSA